MTNNDFLIHGTQIENAFRILTVGKIQSNPPKNYIVMLKNKSSKQIFTQLIYKDIPNEEINSSFWGRVVFILSKQLLKDYPFYSTRVGDFMNKFNNAFANNNSLDEKIIIKSKDGNLSRMPNLTKLKTHINEYCKDNILGDLSFRHSHELLFNKDIPLDKYCLGVITSQWISDKDYNDIAILCHKLNIPIGKVNIKPKNKKYGLNKFIEFIEEILHNADADIQHNADADIQHKLK